jgi:transcription elongation GreA/GreB family factor
VKFEIPILDAKREIVHKAQDDLRAALKQAKARAEDARVAATHEENKPENDKDMRSTESAYIARGQAERVAELERGIAKLAALELRVLTDDDAICVSALVHLSGGGGESTYFLVTEPGGVAVDVQNTRILTLATTSPLGRALLGQSVGDEVTAGPRGVTYEIVAVR